MPRFNTFNCNTLRLWKSFQSEEFDFDDFNRDDFKIALSDKDQASCITSLLYPNDNSESRKELRLKQEYFFSRASIQNAVNAFSKLNLPWSDFS